MMQINILLLPAKGKEEINLGLISIDDALIEIIPFVRKMWQTDQVARLNDQCKLGMW